MALPAKKNIQTIQLLRFIAALMVMVTHTTFYISSRLTGDLSLWDTGAQGVQIFFVISGFVMILTSRSLIGAEGGARYFIISRIIRIAPLYWALNILKIGQIALIPALAFANPSVSNIIFSMLFVPSRNASGAIETFYGVGWTLNFEMFFYTIFAIALLFRFRIISVVGVFLIACAALSLIRTEEWPAVTYLFRPIVLNFLWGMILAELIYKGAHIPPLISICMVAIGTYIVFAMPDINMFEIQNALLVAGVIFLEPYIGHKIPKFFIFGGDASYSLYLVHPMVGVLVAVLLSKLGMNSIPLAFCLIITACMVVSAVVYQYFERPVTRYLRNRFAKRPATKSSKAEVS